MLLDTPDYQRRFGGVGRLYGEAGLAKLQTMHLCVIGIGGVGSWAAEAFARNAVGKITLIDLDNIAESNVNRQLHAVDGAFGKAKVTAMRERILSINPACQVSEIEEFITADNILQLLNFHTDGIVDCIDDAYAKAALAAYCKSKKIPLVVTGGAGGRLDATQIKTADLANVNGDKLLAKVRNLLRKSYHFPKGKDGLKQKQTKMGIFCVYSDEPIIKPIETCEVDAGVTGLNCAGYGSSVCVTAPFGFSAAGLLLNQLLAS
jgi:tRNA A37 threonylcarbamoyladenosine dehydratase